MFNVNLAKAKLRITLRSGLGGGRVELPVDYQGWKGVGSTSALLPSILEQGFSCLLISLSPR